MRNNTIIDFLGKIKKNKKKENVEEQEEDSTTGDLSFLIKKSISHLDSDIFKKSGKIILGKSKNQKIEYKSKLCQINGNEILFISEKKTKKEKYQLIDFTI